MYMTALPSIAEMRTTPPGDPDAAGAERSAAWISAAVVSGVSLITKDPTVFVIGGVMVVALSWWHRHANASNPSLGAATMPSSRTVQNASMEAGAGYSPAI
jgi:predicted NBD/HSP70 family sugar kinase